MFFPTIHLCQQCQCLRFHMAATIKEREEQEQKARDKRADRLHAAAAAAAGAAAGAAAVQDETVGGDGDASEDAKKKKMPVRRRGPRPFSLHGVCLSPVCTVIIPDLLTLPKYRMNGVVRR